MSLLAAALVGVVGIAASQDIARPAGVRVNDPVAFRLARGQRASYPMTFPQGNITIVLDVRRADGRQGGIRGGLTIRESDGRTVEDNAIALDEIEVEHRGVYRFSQPRRAAVTLDVHNADDAANYWLTVVPEQPQAGPARVALAVPLFGNAQPIQMGPPYRETGRLDKGEHAYYITALSAGTYSVSLEFLNPNRNETPLAAQLTLLDGDGATVASVIRMNTVDVSSRQTGTMSLQKGGVFVLKVYNEGGPFDEYYRVDFSMAIVPAAAR